MSALPLGENKVARCLDIAVELEDVASDDVVSGAPQQGICELGTIGNIEAGVWELRGGVVTDTEVDELFVVLSGGAEIELLEVPANPAQAGTKVSVQAGDVMRLLAGTRTRWTVADHIRKVYLTPAE